MLQRTWPAVPQPRPGRPRPCRASLFFQRQLLSSELFSQQIRLRCGGRQPRLFFASCQAFRARVEFQEHVPRLDPLAHHRVDGLDTPLDRRIDRVILSSHFETSGARGGINRNSSRHEPREPETEETNDEDEEDGIAPRAVRIEGPELTGRSVKNMRNPVLREMWTRNGAGTPFSAQGLIKG